MFLLTLALVLITVELVMENQVTLNVYGAAKALGCTSQWIRVLLAEERLPGAEKVDGQWRIPAVAIEQIKQRQAVSA